MTVRTVHFITDINHHKFKNKIGRPKNLRKQKRFTIKFRDNRIFQNKNKRTQIFLTTHKHQVSQSKDFLEKILLRTENFFIQITFVLTFHLSDKLSQTLSRPFPVVIDAFPLVERVTHPIWHPFAYCREGSAISIANEGPVSDVVLFQGAQVQFHDSSGFHRLQIKP